MRRTPGAGAGAGKPDYEQLRAVGRRMAGGYHICPGGLARRLEQVIAVLDNIGGVLEIKKKKGRGRITLRQLRI